MQRVCFFADQFAPEDLALALVQTWVAFVMWLTYSLCLV